MPGKKDCVPVYLVLPLKKGGSMREILEQNIEDPGVVEILARDYNGEVFLTFSDVTESNRITIEAHVRGARHDHGEKWNRIWGPFIK